MRLERLAATAISEYSAVNFLRPEAALVSVLDAHQYAEHFGHPDVGSDAGLSCWLDTLREDHEVLQRLVLEHGGLLLRGLPVRKPEDFEAVASEFLSVQESYIGGVSRRSRIHNNVYNTTEAPSNVVIEQHLEATHTPRPPDTILFNCQTPAQQNGETPLASFVELFDALPEDVTAPLENERVVYSRNLLDRHSKLYKALPKTLTQSLALSWQEVSGCEEFSPARVALEKEGYEVSVRSRKRLHTRCSQPVISSHPITGRKRWYLSDQITRRLPWYTSLGRRVLRSQMGMEFALESGRSFAPGVLDLVHKELLRLRFSFSWRTGDVLILDNQQMSHGRNPYAGERLILTAFG